MSQSPFNFMSLPTRSPVPPKSLLGDAQPKTVDRRVSPGEALNFGGSMLKVRVGTGLKLSTLIIHQDLLTQRSEFFKRVTAEVLQQAHDEQLVALTADDPDIFRVYLNLVYASRSVTRGADEWMDLSCLFVLAEKLQDRAAKN